MNRFIRIGTSAVMAVASPLSAATTAKAASIAAPAVIDAASEKLAPVERVGCWAYGWRGYGWYPGFFRCGGPVYVATPYVAPAPAYVAPPVYAAPNRCWIVTNPARNTGHWGPC